MLCPSRTVFYNNSCCWLSNFGMPFIMLDYQMGTCFLPSTSNLGVSEIGHRPQNCMFSHFFRQTKNWFLIHLYHELYIYTMNFTICIMGRYIYISIDRWFYTYINRWFFRYGLYICTLYDCWSQSHGGAPVWNREVNITPLSLGFVKIDTHII